MNDGFTVGWKVMEGNLLQATEQSSENEGTCYTWIKKLCSTKYIFSDLLLIP